MAQTIRDAYISVEIRDTALQALREGLKRSLQDIGIGCEVASHDAHVSIAYGDGDVALSELEETAREITCRPFTVNVVGFEILHGLTTPFDYLVIKLSSDGAFQDAVNSAADHMETKNFHGGFHSHVSLLRFPKGSLDNDAARRLIREMNAAQSGAMALGCRPCLRGDSVSVFDPERRCCLQVPFDSHVA
jgi:2'-5' RNA ligase